MKAVFRFIKSLVLLSGFLLIHGSLFPEHRVISSTAQASKPLYNSPFQRKKVHLQSFQQSENSQLQGTGVHSKSQTEPWLPAGTDLVLTVDTHCAGTAYYQDQFGQALLQTEARPFILTASRSLEELSREWEANPCILGVSENFEIEMYQAEQTDPGRANQVYLEKLRWQDSRALFDHPSYISSVEIVVAVVDTGIDYNHEDLNAQMWIGPQGEKGANFIDGTSDPMDDNGHGTHCAGIIAATTGNQIGVTGIASHKVKLLPIKVLDSEGHGSLAGLASGIRYAADLGADIINLSLGAPMSSATVEDALQYAVSKGSVVVMASGNEAELLERDNFYSPVSYAKQIQGAISVGSIDAESGKKSDFSNYSPEYVEIAAPGSAGLSKILSTWPGNNYHSQQGTSMASPMVSAAAALVKAFLKTQELEATPELIEKILLESALRSSKLSQAFVEGRELNLLFLKRYLETSYVFQGRGGFEDL